MLLVAPGLAASQDASTKEAGSLTTYITKIIPMIIVGDGWSQRIVLQNVDKWSTVSRLQVFTKDGDPFPIEIRGFGTASSFTLNIQPGNTLVLDLPAKYEPQKLGWAYFEQYTTGPSGDYSGIGDTFGQLIFRKQTPGLPDFMCSMILSDRGYDKLTAFFDNTGVNYTGMGILTSSTPSPSTSPLSLRVTVRDIAGTVISQKTITQKRATLYWMNLGVDFPETVGRMGTFEVEPIDKYSTSLTGVSLQFSGSAFTFVTPFEK